MNLLQKLAVAVLINTSATTLVDVLLINNDDYYPVGLLRPSAERRVEVDCDSVRVAFKLDRIVDEWMLTEPMPISRVIITDYTTVVPVEVEIQ